MSHPHRLLRRPAAIVATIVLGGMLALGGGVPSHASDNYPGARCASDNYPGVRAASDNYPGHHHASCTGHHHGSGTGHH